MRKRERPCRNLHSEQPSLTIGARGYSSPEIKLIPQSGDIARLMLYRLCCGAVDVTIKTVLQRTVQHPHGEK